MVDRASVTGVDAVAARPAGDRDPELRRRRVHRADGRAGRHGVPDPRLARRSPPRPRCTSRTRPGTSRCTGGRTSGRARRCSSTPAPAGSGSAAIQLGLRRGRARDRDRRAAPRRCRCVATSAPSSSIDYRAGDFVDAVKEFTDGRGRRRDLRPGRRRHLRPLHEVHRVRGAHPHHRVHRRSLRRGADQPRADQELLRSSACTGVCTTCSSPTFVHETHAALMQLHADGAIAPLISREIAMRRGALGPRRAWRRAARGARSSPAGEPGRADERRRDRRAAGDPDRRRVVAAMILGASTGDDIARHGRARRTCRRDRVAPAHRARARACVTVSTRSSWRRCSRPRPAPRPSTPEPIDPDVDPEVARGDAILRARRSHHPDPDAAREAAHPAGVARAGLRARDAGTPRRW